MKHRRGCTVLLALVISVSRISFAEPPPPVVPFDTITWKAIMKRKPSADLRMGSFRVRFEKTTLDDVRCAASAGTSLNFKLDTREYGVMSVFFNAVIMKVKK